MELAQLNYLLPRLRGWGEALSRSGGGIGTRMGGGETKLEVDRQHIRRRITKLRRDIKAMAKTRETKRARRQGSGIPQAAIAGYTNAGKSTLLNALTGADVLVADQLFATLDPTVRRLKLPNGRRCTVSDTVGFVSKLPHDLVEAFRSTLEEVTMAELIVHVADAASPDLTEQIEAVRRVLGEIGAGDIPEVLVLNKIDRVGGSERARLARRYAGSVSGLGVDGGGRGRAPADPGGGAAAPARRGDAAGPLRRARTSSRGSTGTPRCSRSATRARGPGSTPASACASWPRSASTSGRSGAGAPEGAPRLPPQRSGAPIDQSPWSAQAPVITVSGF